MCPMVTLQVSLGALVSFKRLAAAQRCTCLQNLGRWELLLPRICRDMCIHTACVPRPATKNGPRPMSCLPAGSNGRAAAAAADPWGEVSASEAGSDTSFPGVPADFDDLRTDAARQASHVSAPRSATSLIGILLQGQGTAPADPWGDDSAIKSAPARQALQPLSQGCLPNLTLCAQMLASRHTLW